MTNTTYYNLNIVEGSDIVNPLTVDNPNYEIIDETMHNNAVSGVTLATEISNATVHAITRENSECAVIRFIATSRWKAGDTVTVDGVPVTALLPSGETLPDGAYVINSNVLCILTGTNMTVFAERKKTDSAIEIKYKDTNVGAQLDKVGADLDKVNSNLFQLIKVVDYDMEYTIKANSTWNTKATVVPIPEGYTGIGIIGYLTNSPNVIAVNMNYSDNQFGIMLKNLSVSDVTQYLHLRVLCLKNS